MCPTNSEIDKRNEKMQLDVRRSTGLMCVYPTPHTHKIDTTKNLEMANEWMFLFAGNSAIGCAACSNCHNGLLTGMSLCSNTVLHKHSVQQPSKQIQSFVQLTSIAANCRDSNISVEFLFCMIYLFMFAPRGFMQQKLRFLRSFAEFI